MYFGENFIEIVLNLQWSTQRQAVCNQHTLWLLHW